MRIFVTGATGFIGSAVVTELLEAGHGVLALARSAGAAEVLAKRGVDAHRGELTDPGSLRAGAEACDAVAHLAFIHDFARYRENGEIDRQAVTAMAEGLEGSGRPLVITSGTMAALGGRMATEEHPASDDSPSAVRAPSERAALAAADRGVRSSVVRLPPTVHGAGDYGFLPALVGIARKSGVSAFVGDGSNRWPAVHRMDAARLFRLALEGAAPGARLHGVAEEGIAMRDIAAVIGEGLDVPVRGISVAQAVPHFDWLANFVAADVPASSNLTRAWLRWRPQERGLLDDLRDAGYFS